MTVHRNVILQTSMKAFSFLDKNEFQKFTTEYAKRRCVSAYLHLDHCKEIDSIKEAIFLGWDSVMIDASDKTLEANIKITNEVCRIAHEAGVLVEAEVGQVCGREEELEVVETGVAKMEDVEKFLQCTNVDMLAVAIGTIHGLCKGSPQIHYDLIEKTAGVSDVPFVIHGGTGLTESTFLRLLSYRNVKKINISTEVKLAYREGLQKCSYGGLLEKENFDPIKVNKIIYEEMKNMAVNKLNLLGGNV